MGFKKQKLEELREILLGLGYIEIETVAKIDTWFDSLFKEYRAETLLTSFEMAAQEEINSQYTKKKLAQSMGDMFIDKGHIELKVNDETGMRTYTMKVLVANNKEKK